MVSRGCAELSALLKMVSVPGKSVATCVGVLTRLTQQVDAVGLEEAGTAGFHVTLEGGPDLLVALRVDVEPSVGHLEIAVLEVSL